LIFINFLIKRNLKTYLKGDAYLTAQLMERFINEGDNKLT